MTAEGPRRLLVLQSTPFCPIACSSCYLPDHTDRRRMSAALLDRIGAEVLTRRLRRRSRRRLARPRTLGPARLLV